MSVRRWRALDAFRGLAVVGMLLVNNPGNHDAVYAQLEHSAWHGCTLADLVFPFFLFVVGITTALSLAAMVERGEVGGRIDARVVRRAAIIFGVGLLLNWFPFYQSGAIDGVAHPGFIDRVVARLLVLRIPGVLQRIAVAYLVAALIARRLSTRAVAGAAALLLISYWMLLTIVPVPSEGVPGLAVIDQPARTIVAHTDRALFDWSHWGLGNHLWDSALTWDPEGALSTIPAIGTVLLGVLCGRWIRGRNDRDAIWPLIAVGFGAMALGWGWGLVFPLNKSLWTSSYVLYTGGIALCVLGACAAALARHAGAWLLRPLVTFGENPLIAYAGSEVGRRILHSSIKIPAPGGRLGVDEWATRAFAHGLSPDAASLAWALLYVAAWWIVLRQLSRRQYFLRA